MVLDNMDYSPGQNLAQDILDILHTFSCRLHGLRRYRNAILRKIGVYPTIEQRWTLRLWFDAVR